MKGVGSGKQQPTLFRTVAQRRLQPRAPAQIRVYRVDPGVARASVEVEVELLRRGADRELGVVASAGEVVKRIERDGAIVSL